MGSAQEGSGDELLEQSSEQPQGGQGATEPQAAPGGSAREAHWQSQGGSKALCWGRAQRLLKMPCPASRNHPLRCHPF